MNNIGITTSEHEGHTEKRFIDQLYNLFKEAPVALCILRGHEFLVEVINERMLEFLDRKKEDLLNKPIFQGLPEDMSVEFKEVANSVYIKGTRFISYEQPLSILRHGKVITRYIKFAIEPLRQKDGTISGVMCVADEITSQVLARKEIEEAEATARVAIESADMGVYKANLLTNTIEGDEKFYQLFGFHHEVSWDDLTSLILPEDQPIRRLAHKVAVDTGKLFYEARFKYKDESVHWLKVYGKFYYENNTPKTLLGVVQDITKQKNLEEQKDNFISIASHELRTPVTTLKAYAQILHTTFTNEKNENAAGMLFKMDKQIDKLTALIVDMLDITKIDRGEIVFNKEEFAFTDMVKEVAEEVQKTTSTHQIVVKLNGCEKITGDRNRIAQVVTNFVSNAIKFSPHAAEILVTADCDHKSVQLSVKDCGIGIAKSDLDNVFKRFFRVNESNKGYTFPGLGLGLFLSAEIIKRHNGTINFQSEIGKGSTFAFELPLSS